MVRPSNPKLMARVLDAVTHLGEGKGSLTRDVLDFVKQNSSAPSRNLTMQVRKALKHAVNAGLLRCKGGRYKMQMELNSVSHSQHHHHKEKNSYENAHVSNDMSDELPLGGTDISRGIQDRPKANRKKRTAKKSLNGSRTRDRKRKVTRRRTATMDRRERKMSKRPRRKTTNDDEMEDWPSRRRRMMSKPHFEDEEEDDDEEEEEEEEDIEEEMRDRRKSSKMKSVNEDTFSTFSGDSGTVGRHRSRRSKHLADERRSTSGGGDADGRRKSTRRSTSRRRRRRSQPRQRDNRQEPAPQEQLDEQRVIMDEERDNEVMEMDEDQADVDRAGTPPDNRQVE